MTRVGGGRLRSTLLAGRFLDLGLKIQATVYGFGPQNPGVRGGRDGTWRHPEACVEAKQRMRKARGRRINYQDYPELVHKLWRKVDRSNRLGLSSRGNLGLM